MRSYCPRDGAQLFYHCQAPLFSRKYTVFRRMKAEARDEPPLVRKIVSRPVRDPIFGPKNGFRVLDNFGCTKLHLPVLFYTVKKLSEICDLCQTKQFENGIYHGSAFGTHVWLKRNEKPLSICRGLFVGKRGGKCTENG